MEKTILEVFGEKSKDGDELVAHTLQSIANMQRGNFEDILYKAKTKSGEDRYIHEGVPGFPTEARREGQYHNLRNQLRDNPSFSDTLSYQKGMEKLAPSKSVIKQLLEAFGY
tara:strand:- start:16 stop:351 length:336 start_codon:yes stop_codon:yes gene_type:complete